MVLQEFINRFKQKRAAFKDMQDQDRMTNTISERKKNSNERELERFMEEDRQAMIKSKLKQFREREKVKQREMTVLKGKNIFQGHKNIMTNNNALFSSRIGDLKGRGFMFHGG